MNTTNNVLPFPLRRHCAQSWCIVDEPEHVTCLSRADGPQTIDEGQVTAAAYARLHRFADRCNLVEIGLWSEDEGGQRELLTADEAEELAAALTHWATEARRPERKPR